MSKPAAPSQRLTRARLLGLIRDAILPEDAKNFRLQDLEDAGLTRHFRRPKGWSDGDYLLFVMFAMQTKELRKKVEALEKHIEQSRRYHSPLWEQAWDEPCPIKSTELRRVAELDDAKGEAQRRDVREPSSRLFMELLSRSDPKWRRRDRRRPYFSFRARLWHQPMTIMKYSEATGQTRRNVLYVLHGLGAVPISLRSRPNEPALYDVQTNHALLCHWFISNVKDLAKRKGWLARTLVECRDKTPEEFDRLFRAVRPVIESLGMSDGPQAQEFAEYLDNCKNTLYPPPPVLDPANAGLLGSLNALLTARR